VALNSVVFGHIQPEAGTRTITRGVLLERLPLVEPVKFTGALVDV
jgi:hypothetical protein